MLENKMLWTVFGHERTAEKVIEKMHKKHAQAIQHQRGGDSRLRGQPTTHFGRDRTGSSPNGAI